MIRNIAVNTLNRVAWLIAAVTLVFPTVTTAADDTARAAFLDVYKVLSHPRCMNCHPIGDAPLQGDDSHPHAFRIRRGKDGKGLTSVRCSNCHQAGNQPGEHTPPGAADPNAEGSPRWQLPPARSPLPFEQRSPQELCRQLLSQSKNGGLNREQLLHHVETDSLVRWGFQPGEGRSTPPLTHAEFVSRFRAWLDAGASCPN
jgi:mono/diheme cytochrome c family protein